MSTNLTYTDIANMALDWCGASLSIQDIDEKQNPDAILCARNLPHAIQTELDSYEWAFARRVTTPVKDESPDRQIPGYICYSLPDDFSRLSMYQFFDYYQFPKTWEYQWGHTYMVQNNRLYTKVELPKLAYISNQVSICEWPSLFCDCVALNLATRICSKIKGLDADIGFMMSLRREKLKDARRLELIQTEAQQGGMSNLQINRWVP